MPQIDYSRLSRPKQASPTGHSVKNSFYMQKSQEIRGRYKAYHEYDTAGMKMTVVGADNGSGQQETAGTTK